MTSPRSASFVIQPASTTHAGGIQPSASFFRPSRPYSRPGSPSSIIDIGIPDHDESDQQHEFVSLKRMKQSREPLLPGPSGPPSVPHSYSPAPSRSATRLVRTSLDRVLSISRGLSFDSTPKRHSHALSTTASMSIPPPTSPSPSPSSPSLSEPPLFNPTPPSHSPPLRAVPLTITNRPVRRWEQHPSRNKFLFNGRLLTGGDTPYAFLASFTIVLGIAGVWFSTTAVWWWLNISPAVSVVTGYLALITISTMITTATTDPGILPRNLDSDPPYPASSPSDGGVRAPMPRDLKVRSDVVRVKYCPTCKTYRPPRSSHCKMCDNCVDGCDHHCQWVNNCIGRRNYTTFFALLLSATLSLILIIVTSALHLYFLTSRDHLSFKQALSNRQGTGSAVAFGLSVSVVWPVAALLTYHMRLLLLNTTTIEQIRNQAHKSLIPSGPAPPNPFSHGSWGRNVAAVLCRPTGWSWLDASAPVKEDRREVWEGPGE
ncbi:DHHC palmitoyltransferase-domain-containing protein [Crepidotus variabilis]|uniref:Palmitoyltransferase n=1 Tax=Crepidotus variabilis TaxID=179855 RepID=A0A9P6EPB0_9AGAR|nr:DHHC palmitoyltransferase-domain-containing protein [Crepidotus variabilis]